MDDIRDELLNEEPVSGAAPSDEELNNTNLPEGEAPVGLSEDTAADASDAAPASESGYVGMTQPLVSEEPAWGVDTASLLQDTGTNYDFTTDDVSSFHYSDELSSDSVFFEQAEEADEDEEEDDGGRAAAVTILSALLIFLTILSSAYLVFIYSDNEWISEVRTTYIQTAMSTLNHNWLATAVIPSEIIDQAMVEQYAYVNEMVGKESDWSEVEVDELPEFNAVAEPYYGSDDEEITDGYDVVVQDGSSDVAEPAAAEAAEEGTEEETAEAETMSSEDVFFSMFYEIDEQSLREYLVEHPEAVADGWDKLYINKAGIYETGTTIYTTYGEQVLAIDAANGILLIRVNIGSSIGVMAICKDTSRLSLCASQYIPDAGETIGAICEANDGILAMTGNAFVDDEGNGSGGEILGLAMCSGTTYGYTVEGKKRLELRNDNRMYIVDSGTEINYDTRDACEFLPALIIDGEIVVDENCGYTGPHPRAAIGQTSRLETMFVVIEGRLSDSVGCSVVPIAELMLKHGCVQALNLDGGTSAMMYFDGEYVTRCSNTELEGGRDLPTAWVVKRAS